VLSQILWFALARWYLSNSRIFKDFIMSGFTKLKAVWPVMALCAGVILSGCSKDDQPVANADAALPAATANANAPLKIAFVYSGPVGDGGWTYSHDEGRKQIEAEFGDRVKTTYVENVADGAEAEKTFRQLAKDGNRLIFGTSFGYMDAMLKVAHEFPNVKFEHATGVKTAENLATYEARTYEGAYMAGIIAGKTTKSDKIGFVASVPIPEVIRNINAFTLGAQSVNPKVTTRVEWVNKWFDPDKERASAQHLVDQGVDIMIQNTDSPAVLKLAQERGVWAFGWDSDMTQFGQKAHLGSAVIDWGPYYKQEVQRVFDNQWQAGASWWGVHQSAVKISSPSPALPSDVLLFLGERIMTMKAAKLKPFQGPLLDQSEHEVVAAGTDVSDPDLKTMHYFVKGVIGSIPM
jgi:simple sugar transport system substrate-binding protein